MLCTEQCLDEQQLQPAKDERRQDAVDLAWHKTTIRQARVSFSTTMSDLDILVVSQLSMADYVATLSQEYLFQLHQLRLMRLSLTMESAKTLVHAFVSSRLDYCNRLLYSVNDELLQKLRVTQNAAARVMTGVRKFDHMTPVLHELYWLLSVASRWHLRSADAQKLVTKHAL